MNKNCKECLNFNNCKERDGKCKDGYYIQKIPECYNPVSESNICTGGFSKCDECILFSFKRSTNDSI